jgi:hypothetical protein
MQLLPSYRWGNNVYMSRDAAFFLSSALAFLSHSLPVSRSFSYRHLTRYGSHSFACDARIRLEYAGQQSLGSC